MRCCLASSRTLAETTAVTRAYARQEQQLRVAVMREIAGVWRANFDLSDVRGSSAVITSEAVARIEPVFRQSGSQGAAYYQQVRATVGVPGTVAVAPVTYQPGAVADTLTYTSRVSLLRSIQAGRTPEQAAHTALTRTIGSAARIATSAGRDTITRTMREDPRAKGWQRVTGGDPCYFCAMIAGRGGVYSSDTVDFEAHDFCQCEPEPVFSRDRRDQMDDQAIQFKELYDSVAQGTDDPLLAFRRAYEARVAPATAPSRTVRSIVGRPPGPPPGLSEAALVDRIQSHVAWAQSQGWNVTVDGRNVVRTMETAAGTRTLVERAADHGQFIVQENLLDGRAITRAAQLRG